MTTKSAELKIGELLIALKFVDDRAIAESLEYAARLGIPLGRALVMTGKLNEQDLETALALHSLVRNAGLALDLAQKAANLARMEDVNLTAALKTLGWQQFDSEPHPSVAKLGSLLLESKLVTEEQFEKALSSAKETGLPLGRTLILMGTLSHSTMVRVIDTQVRLHEGRITHVQAVASLTEKGARRSLVDAFKTYEMEKPGTTKKRIRLGELLMLFGTLTESDIMNALELGLEQGRTVGDSLVDLGLISRELLAVALDLQKKLNDGNISVGQACDAFQNAIPGSGSQFQQRRSETSTTQHLVLGELLKMAGLVNNQDIEVAVEMSTKYPSLIGRMLVVSGAIEESTLLSALRCQYLLKREQITLEDALRALQHAQHYMVAFDDALEELSIGVRL